MGWQEYVEGQNVDSDGALQLMTGFGVFFAVYGGCLVFPAVAGSDSLPVMCLEWSAFFGGLCLIDLIIVNRRERMNVLTEKQYRDEMQTYMSVIRSQRHDYNFHVQTLHGLLVRKDYDACERYLNELLEDSIEMNQILPLQDAAISALILSFKSKAALVGIPMDISIRSEERRVGKECRL